MRGSVNKRRRIRRSRRSRKLEKLQKEVERAAGAYRAPRLAGGTERARARSVLTWRD